jgi:hypothetical protein
VTAAIAAALPEASARTLPGTCGACRHFAGAARDVEYRLPGLRALGSMDGSVRATDGVCGLHDRYLAASSGCASHEPRAGHPPRR